MVGYKKRLSRFPLKGHRDKGDRVTGNTFDRIAPGWYNFRHWSIFRSELETLAKRWQKGSLLNVGCAHGPDFLPFREKFDLYGLDSSNRMLGFARQYSGKFDFSASLFLADACRLPFSDGAFDWAISVATYHHIRGKNERLTALNELRRVLKPGGEAFVTVWNRWQPRFWFKGKETAVPWRTKDETLYRYYHLFSYPELEKLVKQAGFQVLKSFPESSHHYPFKFFSRNICLLVRKS
ncbi:class I SAM-dependent methyltransferase [Chloroflexota bacterium]